VSVDCSNNIQPTTRPHADVPAGVFVVVPAYNEAPAIGAVLHELRAVYPNVVVVDDGSTDGTAEVARIAATYVLRHPINCGQGAALQTGIDFALLQGAEFIVTFDADGQHRVEDVAVLLSPILCGECDFTLGSRFLGTCVGIPPLRRKMLRLGVLFTRLVNGVNLTDAHNGFRAFSRRAAQRINLRLDRMAHATELIDQIRLSGLPFKEVPVQIRYTPYSLRKGQSTRGAIRIALHYLLGRVLL
jgi:glycosyltransferase involved in cell wall biosynthesis